MPPRPFRLKAKTQVEGGAKDGQEEIKSLLKDIAGAALPKMTLALASGRRMALQMPGNGCVGKGRRIEGTIDHPMRLGP
jgi:hypothetical protein